MIAQRAAKEKAARTMPSFYEFFAGGGMARAGLGKGWTCLFANDFDFKKGLTYQANFGAAELKVADIRAVGPGVWNGWKGQLLRDLYYATEAALRGGRTDEHSVRSQLVDRAEQARRAVWLVDLDLKRNNMFNTFAVGPFAQAFGGVVGLDQEPAGVHDDVAAAEAVRPVGAATGEHGAAARVNAEHGVTWVHSYVSPDRTGTFCVYDGPSPEAIRKVADCNGLPITIDNRHPRLKSVKAAEKLDEVLELLRQL